MTVGEVNKMVRIKEQNLNWIQDNMGIWGMPFDSERESLKYWRQVQSGKLPRPMINDVTAAQLSESKFKE